MSQVAPRKGIALLGLGHVGAGVARLLQEGRARGLANPEVRVAVVRDLESTRLVDLPTDLLSVDAEASIARDDVDVVVEAIGGIERARELILYALERKKSVVTANKAVMAAHGPELFEAARRAARDLYFEAAVCGGVPVIRAIREGLASDEIESFTGIVNGTSNYITTQMALGGGEFADALEEAQRQGYAEADPSLDIGGGDAVHKLSILASLSFGGYLEPQSIYVEGLESLEAIDYEMAEHFGMTIKALAIARRHDDGIEARVHPTLVPQSWLLADVPDNKNAVHIRSKALGPSMYYGAGAGMMPTAMSVVSDLIAVCRNLELGTFTPMPTDRVLSTRPMSSLQSRYYLRMTVADEPGALAELTAILGREGVSIAQLIQRPQGGSGQAQIVCITHLSSEAAVQASLSHLRTTELASKLQLLRIAE